MTHIVTNSSDPNIQPQSIQSALVMDQHPQQQQQQQPQSQQIPQSSRKRKKNETPGDEPSEPRRLRRSHEACARCRSKKIKCDSKHPRCTACATAGTPCHQEDRHRQTLTPRGHTERIEHQLKQCDALLKRRLPGFDLNNLDEICAQEGIHIDPDSPDTSIAFQFTSQPSTRYPAQPPPPLPKGYPYPPPQHMVPPYSGMPIPYGSPYPPPPMQMHNHPPPHNPQLNPQLLPTFQHLPMHSHGSMQPLQPQMEIKGQDPQYNDMSNTQALAKNFGVNAAIIDELGKGVQDNEDLAVGSGGLTSGRDRRINEASLLRDSSKWISVNLPRNRIEPTTAPMSPPLPSIKIWLPKDRQTVNHIVNVYFSRLNYNRPALDQGDFDRNLNALYDGHITVHHDQGFICMLYLVLALGTLNEVNHRANKMDKDGDTPASSPTLKKKLMPEGWPEHGEFFQWGLFYKPDIQATISALQALILLHWYLYTERQGRTLWRLVGVLVRLAVELGLHHDPIAQGIFTEAECHLRIRLWGIVMVHDRGTSLLLGRPLGIAPYDSNTSRPSRLKNRQKPDYSEHFLLSHPIAEIQADIINSLYTPTSQRPDTIMRHATRIIKGMVEFKRQLPEKYQRYFHGSEELPLDQRSKLVEEITEDEGLTLLKIGISRILLLRVLFNSEALVYSQRQKSLVDAVVTAHNIIIIHNHLIRFPDIGFFVSPIPLHIAAMVILYGHMSHSKRLPKEVVIQDIWMALDVLPRMRWRWERKDVNGEHPLIANLAERVLDINLREVVPSGDHIMLLSEQDWDSDASLMSPSMAVQKQEQMTPVMPNTPFPIHEYPHNRVPLANDAMNRLGNDTPPDGKQQLMEVPPGLFYPFFPERKVSGGRNGPPHDFNELLAAVGAQPGGSYLPDPYITEEDASATHSRIQMWIPPNVQTGTPYPITPA